MANKKKIQINPGAYEDAILGFRNHWYPGMLSNEIAENEVKPLVLLGENVLFKRIDGEVFAIRDNCAHRGYKFSEHVECFTKNTITCPIHAFTYNFRNGKLVTIPSDPNSNLIGKLKIHSYPVQEFRGMVFVFVGDMEEPPPLADDLPPAFTEEGMYIIPAVNVDCDCNWRIAADSGFDPNHVFMHKDNPMLKFLNLPFPFASRLKGEDTFAEIKTIEGDGPKGLVDDLTETIPVFEHTFECDGEVGTMKAMFVPEADNMAAHSFYNIKGSLWMPGILNVDPFPVPGMCHFEWWVPIDETRHRYFIAYGKRTKDRDEQQVFSQEVVSVWKHQGYDNFNWYDTKFNNGMQEFYGDEDYAYGQRETMSRGDGYTLTWRRLASKHNRGLQTRYGK